MVFWHGYWSSAGENCLIFSEIRTVKSHEKETSASSALIYSNYFAIL